jgi:hypothetical protein
MQSSMHSQPVLQLAAPPRKITAIVAVQKITVFGLVRNAPA